MSKSKNSELTLDAILRADDLPVKKVDVPEWGGYVYIRSFTAGQRGKWEAEVSGDKLTAIREKFVVMVTCDKDGNLLFTDEHIAALGEKSGAALDRILAVGLELNRVTEDDVKELEGNS